MSWGDSDTKKVVLKCTECEVEITVRATGYDPDDILKGRVDEMRECASCGAEMEALQE